MSQSIPHEYRLGIDEIDAQHGVLFEQLHILNESLSGGDGWSVLHTTLSELDHWAYIHFAVEESLMRIFRYPDTANHIAQHRAFSQRLETLRRRSVNETIAIDASRLLYDWLMQHILIEDRKYAEHFLAVSRRIAETK